MNIFDRCTKGFLFGLSALLLVGGFFVATPGVSAAGRSDVIINEFSPASSPEWVELLNTTDASVDLSGWQLTDLESPGTADQHEDLNKNLAGLTVPPRGIITVQVNNLNNDGDSLGLYSGDFNNRDNLSQLVTYGNLSGALVSAPNATQSVSLSGSNWAIADSPTKGWFNDAESAPSLSQIDADLLTVGINSNIGELSDPSATPNTEASGALYFEKAGKGRIVFEKQLNLSDPATVAILGNLVAALDISSGHIKFDSQAAQAIKASGAKIYFYGLTTETQPTLIVKDDQGTVLDQSNLISNISYTDAVGACEVGASVCKTFSFNTNHFTQFELQNKVSDVYVDASKIDDSGDGLSPATAKKTLQAGLSAIDEKGTIHVVTGVYAESVLINKPVNLVKSGAGEVTITGQTSSNFIVRIENVNDVTLDGLTIDGTGSSVGANGFEQGILLSNSGTKTNPVTIKNSVVKNIWANSSNGIDVDNGSYAILDHNVISSFHKRGVRFINSSGEFSNNEVIGDNVDGKFRVQNLVNLWGGSDVEIYGNKLHNALTVGEIAEWDSPAIFVSSYVASGAGNPSRANIHDNEIYNGDTGVVIGSFYAGNDTSSADIVNNNFHDLNRGINFEKNTASITSLTGNKFSNSNLKALSAELSEGALANPPVVNAENNWWGTANQSKIAGLVYSAVDFSPYYVNEAKTILSSTIPSSVYVDKSYTESASGSHIFGYDAFSTIQAGIDAVAAYGTVNVAPGTYNEENISITKPVILQGAGSDSTIVDASASTSVNKYVFNINLSSGNVKLDGFQIKNGKELNSIGAKSASADSVITISNNKIIGFGPSDKIKYDFGLIGTSAAKVIVEHNLFHNTSSNPILFEKQTGETLVNDNDFTGVATSLWYMTYNGVNVTTLQRVSNNRIDASQMADAYTAIGFASSWRDVTNRTGKYSNIEISNNTITGLKSFGARDAKAISVANENNTDGLGGEITTPKISGNTISGTGGIGIQLIGYVTDADVNNNTVSGVRTGLKAFNGSYSANFYPVRAVIRNNKIVDTSDKALNWLGSDSLDASNNWWGTAVKSDIQSKISGNVSFVPYYINEAITTLSNLRSITSFTIPNQRGASVINQEAGTISLTMPYGTDVTALEPSFEIIGQSLKVGDIDQISGQTKNNFISPVTYKIYSTDGGVKDYIVSVTVLKNPAKSISSFTIGNQVGNTLINEAGHLITVTLPSNVNAASLSPVIAIVGASVSPESGMVRDFTNPVAYTVTAADGTRVDYTVKVISLTAAQTAPDENGQVAVSQTAPEAIIVNPTQAITIAVSNNVEVAKVNVSSLINGGTGVLPEIVINSQGASNTKVSIPALTTVTSSDPNWNGIISTPKVVSVSLPDTSGQTKTLSTAIELGFSNGKLIFDKAVRILMLGQSGKRAGYVGVGTNFTEITTVCDADSQASGDALAPGGECKIDVGNDLVIWTKHFTSFATYTQTATTSSGGGGGGGYYVQPTVKKGDANNDGKVNILDFVALMADWNKTGSNIAGDFNKDGKVDVTDFVALMANWTK